MRFSLRPLSLVFVLTAAAVAPTPAEPAPPTAINAGRIPSAYPVAYAPATRQEIGAVLDRVLAYLEAETPVKIVDRDTGAPVADLAQLPAHPGFAIGTFFLTSYEWGVTYAGMLNAADVTGDARYRDYVATRLGAVARLAAHLRPLPEPPAAPGPARISALRNVLSPRALDDSGSMCAAMIKASRAGLAPEALRPCIDNYIRWIATQQFRLADGTLARNRPLANTLWLDDLYMSVPALAQMGALTGEAKYFDDAVKQILQFSGRMFVPEAGLYRHGWVQEMEPHPAFYWARANGWAAVAMAELLSVLPEDHPGRAAVLAQFRAHVRGIAAAQGGAGLWHQLMDRNDSYLETSASAMFCYAIARGINRGWLDRLACGPCASVAWNAVAQKVNTQGQVEGTCVGTGMGFEPMFYCYRPVSVYAAHGYGPLLLAGAEMIALRAGEGRDAGVSDGAVQFAPSPSRH